MHSYFRKVRSPVVRGDVVDVKATRGGDKWARSSYTSSVKSGASSEGSQAIQPPVAPGAELPESVLLELSGKGKLDAYLAKRDALWRSYYACNRAYFQSVTGHPLSIASSVSSGRCSQETLEKFADLGLKRRSWAASATSLDKPECPFGIIGSVDRDISPADYADPDKVESLYGQGGCYLNLVRNGYVPQVWKVLGKWPTLSELLAMPGGIFIQPGGLRFRQCEMVGDVVHITVGYGGVSFVDVLAQLKPLVALPAWAGRAIAAHPGVKTLEGVLLSTRLGGSERECEKSSFTELSERGSSNLPSLVDVSVESPKTYVRNLDVPVVRLPQDTGVFVSEVFDKFLKVACVPNAKEKLALYQNDPVVPSVYGEVSFLHVLEGRFAMLLKPHVRGDMLVGLGSKEKKGFPECGEVSRELAREFGLHVFACLGVGEAFRPGVCSTLQRQRESYGETTVLGGVLSDLCGSWF